jgi:hypothetical protein
MSDSAETSSSPAPVGTSELGRRALSRSSVARTRGRGGVVGTVAGGLATALLFVLLFLPPAVLAVVSAWAAAVGIQALWAMAQLLQTWRVGDLLGQLPSLDAASRLALLGASFFAVIFALVVFLGGAFARGRRQLFLVLGVLLATPSLIIFVQSGRTAGVLLTELGLPLFAQVLLFAYLLLDALLIALLLTDARPRYRRGSRVAHRRGRFAPSRPLEAAKPEPRPDVAVVEVVDVVEVMDVAEPGAEDARSELMA